MNNEKQILDPCGLCGCSTLEPGCGPSEAGIAGGRVTLVHASCREVLDAIISASSHLPQHAGIHAGAKALKAGRDLSGGLVPFPLQFAALRRALYTEPSTETGV